MQVFFLMNIGSYILLMKTSMRNAHHLSIIEIFCEKNSILQKRKID